MKRLLLLFVICTASKAAFTQDKCELIVRVENIKEIKGSLMIAIYNHEDHFLTKEMISASKSIDSTIIEFSFELLGQEKYAVSIYQDENDNGKLDSNFMGIPSEPYAFSNNAKGMFGPPSFEDCKFEVKGGAQKIIISL
ncbi:DUF2141 domain-containing protein [Ekhidna sp.]|uniref:DUF2141 domain-containing protein n=1 Tax=Ekhidna sp. TaxID=2608089 RepID=UPI003B50604B